MKQKAVFILITAAALLIPAATAFSLSGEEIVAAADRAQTFESAIATGEFRITDIFGTKISAFKSWERGTGEFLIEFTSRAERGQKVLRTADEIYLYYPDAEELIRMQGSALRQGMLGSDISYEDMTGGKDRASQYDIQLNREESFKGRDCWVLTLTALTRTVPYPKEIVWIDKETYIVMKGEYYTKSGRLLKEMEVLRTGTFEGRVFAAETLISDKMKNDTETLLILNDLQINVRIDPEIFSLQELSW